MIRLDFSIYFSALVALLIAYISVPAPTKQNDSKSKRFWLLYISIVLTFWFILPNISPIYKKDFFLDSNFKFSYITETVLMIAIVLFSIEALLESCIYWWNYIIAIITSLSLFCGLIWLSVLLSNILCFCISNHLIFIIISLTLNIIVYFIYFFLIIFFVLLPIDKFFHEQYYNNLTPKEQIKYQEYTMKELKENFPSTYDRLFSNNSSIEKFQNREMSPDEILLQPNEILLEGSLNKESENSLDNDVLSPFDILLDDDEDDFEDYYDYYDEDFEE